jgi:hypothetical protein
LLNAPWKLLEASLLASTEALLDDIEEIEFTWFYLLINKDMSQPRLMKMSRTFRE